MKPIIILNGPKGVGKDTIAAEIRDCLQDQVFTTAFKNPMFEVLSATLGLSLAKTMQLYETPGWKDTPQVITNNKTPRELMIHLSEAYVKPFFGESHYGEQVSQRIFKFEHMSSREFCWIIPDGGFQVEVDALLERYKDRVVVLQLKRKGHETFEGDSRGWVINPNKEMKVFDTSAGNGEIIKYIKGIC